MRFGLFISFLSLFAFSALFLAMKHFTRNDCLQISGLKMCGVTWKDDFVAIAGRVPSVSLKMSKHNTISSSQVPQML